MHALTICVCFNVFELLFYDIMSDWEPNGVTRARECVAIKSERCPISNAVGSWWTCGLHLFHEGGRMHRHGWNEQTIALSHLRWGLYEHCGRLDEGSNYYVCPWWGAFRQETRLGVRYLNTQTFGSSEDISHGDNWAAVWISLGCCPVEYFFAVLAVLVPSVIDSEMF